MAGAPEKSMGEDGLPIPPYKIYNIGNNQPENLLYFVEILQEELINAKVLPENFDFESHKELVAMQPGMSQLPMQIQIRWNEILILSHQLHLERACANSQYGIRIFI